MNFVDCEKGGFGQFPTFVQGRSDPSLSRAQRPLLTLVSDRFVEALRV
jgi:hypothetical protein